MAETLSLLSIFLSYPFVQRALVVGVLVALCSSLLGTTLVMKRLSFIGDGLSHVAFGAYAVAAVANITNNMLITMPVTILAAILLLRRGNNTRVKGDAAMTMLSVASLAAGYLLMNVFGTSSNVSGDVCTTLFGSTSILTLTEVQVMLCIGVSIVVVAAFVLLYNRIFSITFDEAFAQATGLKTGRYNMIVAVMVAGAGDREPDLHCCSSISFRVCVRSLLLLRLLAAVSSLGIFIIVELSPIIYFSN